MSEFSSVLSPVEYMRRTREYYAAQGYSKSYRWAHNEQIPFHVLQKPLNECTVTFVTTAVPDGSIAKMARTSTSHLMSDIPNEFLTDELSWDKEATHMEDPDSFLPLRRLEELAASGRIGRLAPSFHCVPTEYSQRRTREVDAPEVLERCRRDGADVAVLVPL